MSLGLHRVWKDDFVKMLGPRRGTRIVDLAGGTGDISFRIVRAMADIAIRRTATYLPLVTMEVNSKL